MVAEVDAFGNRSIMNKTKEEKKYEDLYILGDNGRQRPDESC